MTDPRHAEQVPSSPQVRPFGEWPSPLAIAAVAGASSRLGALLQAGALLWWTEGRPAEQGRNALCRLRLDVPGAAAETVLPLPWNVRNRVHEYGGGTLASDGARLWFCHDGDAGVHELDAHAPAGGTPRLLVKLDGMRFADLRWWPARASLLAVCEDHRGGTHEPANRLVEIQVDQGERGRVRVLAEGQDFYASPAPSPDGRWLAWLSWCHPAMPWDGTELWCAAAGEDGLQGASCVAGGPQVSVFQPEWSPQGVLHLVSDESGWWNLACIDPPALAEAMAQGKQARCRALCPMAAEFGQPQWEFAMRSYGFEPDGGIVAIARADGVARLGRVADGQFEDLGLAWQDLRALHVAQGQAWCHAGAPDQAESLIEVDLARRTTRTLVAPPAALPAELVSRPVALRFPGSRAGGSAGAGGSAAASGSAAVAETQAFFYPPHHPGFRAPEGELPPVIVINHGGPTASTSSTLRLAVQFWTTRGIAVLDVNYGGSTGFGRAYRQRLAGQWGVVDVEDAVAGVRWLAEQGLVDGRRTAIRGSSAGGYTALAALAFHDAFRAAVSLYGIGDLSLLASDTHKFESRYLDSLVAPWPEGRDIYHARSPLHHVDRMQAALLLLQGAEDKVVPPNQAQGMFDAVRAKGLPVALLLFEGEQHGFRRADTLERALAAELYFYGKVFGFQPADRLAPVQIANLR